MSNQQPYPSSYDGHDPHEGQQASPSPQEPFTQTWEAQTWDTQFQPVQQPYRPQDPAPSGAAADAAYASAQDGAYPLPPEAHGQSAQYPAAQYPGAQYPAAPTAYEPAPEAYRPAPEEYAPAAAAYEPAHAATAAPAPHPAATGSASYSSPTTGGNARITDAQRARAEGRSPVIAPGMQPAALTAVLALLFAGAAAVGQYALVVPLVLLQAVTAAGWFRLNGMWPARQGIALAFLGGVTADIALLAVDAEHAPAAIIGTLGVWVLLTLVLQLRNRAPADERMYGLTATVTSAALAVMAAGHLAAASEAVTVGGVAVAVAVLARALPLPGVASVIVALLAAAGAGIAAGGMTNVGADGALLGLAAGVCALIGLRVASYDYPSRFVHMTAGVALPLTAAAPAVYLIGRVIS
ncbi:hypothetical protein [Streptomyces sp. ISL-100]|uniref:hypothetical protein n=1 Tax=Streptomyces sp. ISL-100 TaxID=2819173 RepID=UPI0020357A04|nr:hypothetical protein [Streptomyces sp. ISL-100]